jgi:hypothetical protein
MAGEANLAGSLAVVNDVRDDRRRSRLGAARIVDGARALAVRLAGHGRVVRGPGRARVHAGFRRQGGRGRLARRHPRRLLAGGEALAHDHDEGRHQDDGEPDQEVA